MPLKPRAKKVDSINTKRGPAQTSSSLPDWPLLQPLIPAADLALETLLQDQIIVIRNLFTSTLCEKYVSFLSSLSLITSPAQPKEENALRVNDRIQFNDPAFAEQLWNSTALKGLVAGSIGYHAHDGLAAGDSKQLWGGEVCGLNPKITIYRYDTASFTFVPLSKICELTPW